MAKRDRHGDNDGKCLRATSFAARAIPGIEANDATGCSETAQTHDPTQDIARSDVRCLPKLHGKPRGRRVTFCDTPRESRESSSPEKNVCGHHTSRVRSREASAYLALVIVAGLTVLAVSGWTLVTNPPDLRWVALALLTVMSGLLTLRMPAFPVSFSISDVFTFTAALMFGPAAGAMAVAIDAAVVSMRLVRSPRTADRYLFNVSAAALAMVLAASGFFALSGTAPLARDGSTIVQHLWPLLAFAALYFVLNTGLVAEAIALAQGEALWRVWRAHFLSLWPGYFGGVSAAGLAVFLVATRGGDLRVLAFILPFPMILYVTFKAVVERMQDQVGHLTRVNSMYLATIETLAQAVDARDQVTHDHVRRVQRNAMRLARELGIQDDAQLRALEAAALLHDAGKLGIPEHILNKPDRLTPAEFETMKLHAAIGAEILSPIDFPFPVVPIVRHHHENWDGTGYPDGLRGTEIPIGARIIAVVDCLDALTSDRPYRRALPADRAFELIERGRGTMYDPAVVDALIRVRDALTEPSPPSVAHRLADTIAQAKQASKDVPTDAVISAAIVNLAGRLGQTVGRNQGLESLCDEIGERLSLVMPGLTIVVYQYDVEADALFSRAAAGIHSDAVSELTIGVGLRLTGWVAANRRTIVNSEAALDLGNLAAALSPPPRLCLSTPIADDGQLVGALTVYSTSPRPFTTGDVVLFEMLSNLLAPRMAAEVRARIGGEASFGTPSGRVINIAARS